ncbi:hypothetical protein [Flaviaesturariibacter terrae]
MRSDNPDKPLFAETDLLSEMPEGVRFREAEVWAGLESSLARRRRRVFVMRLSVAATLLLALALGWWLRPQPQRPQPETARVQPHKESIGASREAVSTPDVAIPQTATVEIRKHATRQPATGAPQPEPSQQTLAYSTPGATLDTQRTNAVATSVAASGPVQPERRRFRIGHINENAPVLIASNEPPVEERSNYSIFHSASVNAGPNPDLSDGSGERKPRTLLSVFKPHQ